MRKLFEWLTTPAFNNARYRYKEICLGWYNKDCKESQDDAFVTLVTGYIGENLILLDEKRLRVIGERLESTVYSALVRLQNMTLLVQSSTPQFIRKRMDRNYVETLCRFNRNLNRKELIKIMDHYPMLLTFFILNETISENFLNLG